MKASTLNGRIAKSNNKNGSQPRNPHYGAAIEVLDGFRVQIGFSGFSNGHGQIRQIYPMQYLRAWGIDYEIGNDAPRGGKNGDFIKLTQKGLRQTKDYRDCKVKLIEAFYQEKIKLTEKRKEQAFLKYQDIKTAGLFPIWNDADLKAASGLSWTDFRNDLKVRFPQEWLELKEKFKKQA